ncbi:hypothetical protein GO755_26595 [Spirosoma sp. HMF4905]|uniref:Uncharacterized protein n=1 Tax=Spirosoma arboris TaxID=2682092 RepID=A0A7K1SJ82_9BACT|nr:hypothetical protein [Spirosoma arboris]MVM33636.1 hypothetical protein [Spirosoma arboris]
MVRSEQELTDRLKTLEALNWKSHRDAVEINLLRWILCLDEPKPEPQTPTPL